MQAETIHVPVLPRLLADDITPERCAGLLAKQGGRLAVVSAEGGISAKAAGTPVVVDDEDQLRARAARLLSNGQVAAAALSRALAGGAAVRPVVVSSGS